MIHAANKVFVVMFAFIISSIITQFCRKNLADFEFLVASFFLGFLHQSSTLVKVIQVSNHAPLSTKSLPSNSTIVSSKIKYTLFVIG